MKLGCKSLYQIFNTNELFTIVCNKCCICNIKAIFFNYLKNDSPKHILRFMLIDFSCVHNARAKFQVTVEIGSRNSNVRYLPKAISSAV